MKSPLVLCLALLSCSPDLATAGNGRISGNVRHRSTMAGVSAHVTVLETGQATTADSTGRYSLLNVLPGTYRVAASAVGYQTITHNAVRVSADESVAIDFLLDSIDIQLPEIIIPGRGLAVEVTRTSAKSTFEGVEVEALPLTRPLELVSTAPGMYGPFIRGSLQFFSRVYVDGVDVTDRTAFWSSNLFGLSNTGSLNVPAHVPTATADEGRDAAFLSPIASATEQATLYAGMANADYGTAPGVITYTHRQGSGPWGGRVQFRMSQLGGTTHAGPSVYNDQADYFAMREQLARSTWAPSRTLAQYFTWTRDKYPYGGEPSFECEFGAGRGFGVDAGLYLTGRWSDLHGRLPAERTRTADLSAKIHMAPLAGARVTILGMLQDRGLLLGWKNRTYDDYARFYLEGVPRWDGVSAVGSVRFSHVLSPTTFYELQLGVSYVTNRRGYCDDNADFVLGFEEDGAYLTFDDTTVAWKYLAPTTARPYAVFAGVVGAAATQYNNAANQSYLLCSPPFLYERRENRVLTVKTLFSTQFLSTHQFSAGGEIRFQKLTKLFRSSVFSWNKGPCNEESWTRYPMEFGGYVQDRMEYRGLVATIGLRVDGFYPGAADYVDYFAYGQAVQAGKPVLRGENIPLRVYLSPRVGFSHPLSDRASVYFSLARTVSPHPYSTLYYNYNQFVGAPVPFVGRSPLSSITYDLGAQWRIIDPLLVSLGAYYRDMSSCDLGKMQPLTNVVPYYVYSDLGFADSKGLEMSVEYRGNGILSGVHGRLSYAYAQVHSSSALDAMNKWQYTAQEVAGMGIPGRLPFELMHAWNSSYTRTYTTQSTALGGFDRTHQLSIVLDVRLPLECRLGTVARLTSGFYYPLEYTAEDEDLEYRGGYGVAPWTKRVDLRLEKSFDLTDNSRIGIFVDLINAFNWTNIMAYFRNDIPTYRAWAERGDPTGGPGVHRPITHLGSMIYGIPREIYFGLTISF